MASRAVKRQKTAHTPTPGGRSAAAAATAAAEPPNPAASSTRIQKQFFRNAAEWDLEANYKDRRHKSTKKDRKKERESTRLPIKTADGRVQRLRVPEGEQQDDAGSVDSDWLENEGADMPEAEDDDEEAGADSAQAGKKRKWDEAEAPESRLPESEQLINAKNELARLALALSENPEENASAFKALAVASQSRLESVVKLGLATQMAVYKDIIPGYRIRPPTEEKAGGRAEETLLSKEVRRLRSYEQALAVGYGNYVKELARHARGGAATGAGMGPATRTVAIVCACTLLTAVPHFNFRSELIKIVVGRLSSRKAKAIASEDTARCFETLQALFRDDDDGRPSLEAVSMLCRMMRARHFRVDEAVVNLFLHLRLLAEFGGTGSADRVDNPAAAAPAVRGGGKKQQQRSYLSKRDRKARQEDKALEREMSQASALVTHEERDRLQGEMLRMVFACYLRILKAGVSRLRGAVLEGLARYAHLINQDFFGDILEVLKDLVRCDDDDDDDDGAGEDGNDNTGDADEPDAAAVRNLTRESLLCIITAFVLLAGQDAHNSRAKLDLDLTFFTTHLFTSLLPLATNPDLELTPRALELREALSRHHRHHPHHHPHRGRPGQVPSAPVPTTTTTTSRHKVNAHTTTVLLIRSLTAVLLPRWNIRSVPPLRLAAFAKQLMGAAVHLPEKSARAVLALLADVVREHGRKVSGLWSTEERRGDGTWLPLGASAEQSNPGAATVWEGEILRWHFSPAVREGVGVLEKSVCEV